MNPDRRRRKLLLAVAGSLVSGAPSLAQSGAGVGHSAARGALGELAPAQNTIPPERKQIGPFPEDKDRVFFFFSFECGFSAMVHEAVSEWGSTVPAKVRFRPVPIVLGDADLAASNAHSFVRTLYPNKLVEFERTAYAAVRRGKPYASPETYRQALRLVLGDGAKQVRLTKQSTEDILARALRNARLSARYQVDTSPCFAVGGTLILSANQTNGDYQALIALVNGAISRILEG
jgi:thiol:disulfide interchange protein DsbA